MSCSEMVLCVCKCFSFKDGVKFSCIRLLFLRVKALTFGLNRRNKDVLVHYCTYIRCINIWQTYLHHLVKNSVSLKSGWHKILLQPSPKWLLWHLINWMFASGTRCWCGGDWWLLWFRHQVHALAGGPDSGWCQEEPDRPHCARWGNAVRVSDERGTSDVWILERGSENYEHWLDVGKSQDGPWGMAQEVHWCKWAQLNF